MLLTEKRRESAKMAKPQICSYCVLDRPVFEWNQVLLHPELTPLWSFRFADGAHHKKPHFPSHPTEMQKVSPWHDISMLQLHMAGMISEPTNSQKKDCQSHLLVCDLNRTPNCYGKTWRLLCPFFRNLHLRENLARDCFTSTASTVTNSVQNISLTVYVIVTNTLLQPLTTTFYNSMLVSFSLLKI